jgi:PPM family protein phosphatase
MNPSLGARGSLITNRGMKRPKNEDACLFRRVFAKASFDAPVDLECLPGDGWIIAVADGLGGQQGGERASEEVVRRLEACRNVTPSAVSDELSRLNEHFVQITQRESDYAGLGATIAGIACGEEGLFAFNVGDARVYRQQDRFLVQITSDDSVAELLATAGEGSEESVRGHSQRRLTQAVGGRTEVKPIDTHIYPLKIKHSCLFLICSDGLSDVLSLDRMEELVAKGRNPPEMVHALFNAACETGCNDNVSIIVAEVNPERFETVTQDKLS